MPRPTLPPTPNDTGGQKSHFVTPPAFELPPTAFQEPDRASSASVVSSNNGSDSSYHPGSPVTSSRKKTIHNKTMAAKDGFSLPPPPSRARKIIQMKPRSDDQDMDESHPSGESTQSHTKQTAIPSQASGKRKGANANTTAAGRKIARKTAHSLIERRRRSKMNEEFGVLKDMVPACRGQEMHKLAILQASIEYMEYLERCIADLRAQSSTSRKPPVPPSAASLDEEMEADDDGEEEVQASTPVIPTNDYNGSNISLPSLAEVTTSNTSPSIFSTHAGRHYSVSSTSQASYSPYFHSTQASPAFGPQLSHTAPSIGLGSPALKPMEASTNQQLPQNARLPGLRNAEHDLDSEASAALLMLNHDRRNWNGRDAHTVRIPGAGLSVRDLLSG